MMKKCRTCNEVKVLEDFYAHPQMGDGHLNKCKECTKKRIRNYRQENLEKVREYDRNRPNGLERRLAWSVKGKANPELRKKIQEWKNAWAERNPHKRKAQGIVSSAIQKGDLLRPEICSNCKQAPKSIQAHHEDYEKPLDIIWLCATCHSARHKEINAMRRSEADDRKTPA
jgi:hypothetical protein